MVQTFTQLTGLPINHFIEIDFAGFWHAVNILGGVYVPVDHRYYNPAEQLDCKSIDIEPGYQLRARARMRSDFVRFRHDQQGDFTRMQRQQLFLKELQRQSGRWSGDWGRVVRSHQGGHAADHLGHRLPEEAGPARAAHLRRQHLEREHSPRGRVHADDRRRVIR